VALGCLRAPSRYISRDGVASADGASFARMLTVALAGDLRRELVRLRRTPILTRVDWVEATAENLGAGATDLVIEPAAARSTDESVAPKAQWARPPADEEIDLQLQHALQSAYGFVVGRTQAMHDACRRIRALAHPMARVIGMRALVTGQTGVGKELAARAVHQLGPSRGAPFVAVNCAALPTGLAASELFGHVRGAFTGALQNRTGALAQAGRGVLFLDEIGDMPLDLQSQLLRALETRSFTAVGSAEPIELQAQVLSATNQGLPALVERGAFRADLFFRLAQITLYLPSLEERRADLDLLVAHFWAAAEGPAPIDPAVLPAVQSRRWTGNLRELRSAIQRLVLMRVTRSTWTANDVRSVIGEGSHDGEPPAFAPANLAAGHAALEREVLTSALRRAHGNTEAVARELGVSRRTVYNLLKRHGLRAPSK
jgi:DNA-binding NtrC family response regulator